ncbi:hypothetical protein DJ73_08655 [Halorubrum sp. Ea1]|uniref:hypothetical protein n=1 Tax=Halorubrum sp. Ea1 TaxID=1480718 RepID=UPI000B997089|nr:hypothetical protein [Halorubrum sp. Ea1]OYR53184.1 hypothetical protein DJ73_08655 [Halorubrum sp. Ea1]
MTTPNDATTPETTRPTDQQTTDGDRSTTRTDRSTTRTDRSTTGRPTTDRTPTDDTSPGGIPGRTPITEEAGAPLVPTTTAERSPTTADPTRRSARAATRPPTDAERDAPLVPDLRPTGRTRTDGGSR